jgi:hypothetical protein
MYPDVLFVVANLLAMHRKEKDPLKPKYPISAFFAFSQSRRPALLEEKKPVTEVLRTNSHCPHPVTYSSGQQAVILLWEFSPSDFAKECTLFFNLKMLPCRKFVMNHEIACRFQRYWEKNGKP